MGPLSGIKVLEVGGIGPVPFCGMLLSDMGAEVVLIERKTTPAGVFKSRTRDEWCEILEGTDPCFAPVLNMSETPLHPPNLARSTFVEVDGVTQPAPAPRFSRTPGRIRGAAPARGEHSRSVLRSAGFSEQEIAGFRAQDVI